MAEVLRRVFGCGDQRGDEPLHGARLRNGSVVGAVARLAGIHRPETRGMRSGRRRETTQPNRTDTLYWATGLTPIYLEGALQRALHPMVRARAAQPGDAGVRRARARSRAGTAASTTASSIRSRCTGRARRCCAVSSAPSRSWHLVNIVRDHQLSDLSAATLNAMRAPISSN